MYQDDFYAFFNDRKERILQKMEIAMGKVIVREYEALEEGEYLSEEDEFDEYDENVQLELSL